MSSPSGPQRTASSQSNPILIGTKEVARLLGLSISTIRRYDEFGKIPEPMRIGEAKRWRRKEIQAWAKAGCPDRDDWNARFPSRAASPASSAIKPAE